MEGKRTGEHEAVLNMLRLNCLWNFIQRDPFDRELLIQTGQKLREVPAKDANFELILEVVGKEGKTEACYATDPKERGFQEGKNACHRWMLLQTW